MRRSEGVRELAYEVDLIGNIRQVLAGLQGYDTMALELLQNADDAGASTIRFDIRKDRLIIQHDSSFSSCGLAPGQCDWITDGNPNGGHRPCDFHSVSLIAAGGKALEAGQIGRFGIGFVSVYQVTDAPILRSTGVRLRLDPLTRRNQIDDDDTGDGTEVILPWADHRTPTRRALQTSETPADVCSRIETALKRVSCEGLLFLKSLKIVEIARSGNVISKVEVTRSPERLNVRIDGIDHRWLMLRGDAAECARGLASKFEQLAELRRSTEVVVAFPLDAHETLAGLLYAFLPTGQEFGLPCHINADFFPRQDRRSIDVTGESHERHFNALLLETAAETIGAALETLKTEIGSEGLWDLLQAAGRLEDAAPVFRVFWTALAEAARRDAVGLTTSQRWAQTAQCVLPSADFPPEHELAAEAVGLSVIHPALRSRRNILLKLGARQLTLGVLLDAIEAHEDFPLSTEAAELAGDRTENLWALAETLLPGEKATDRVALLERLTACEFFVDADGEATSIDAQYRAETADAARAIRRFVPEVPLMSERLRAFPGLFDLVARVTVDAIAGPLARALPTSEAGLAHLGGARGAFELFSLLTGFEVDPARIPAIRAALANACLLPSGNDLLSPSRALWPGGFSDPIGHFRLIDADRLPLGADRFVREVLGVQVLTFKAYLDDHLEAILAAEPEIGAYKNLMVQIVRHEPELGEGGLAALRSTALVRTEGGRFVQPSEAYERSPERLILLGEDGDWWLDSDWLPDGADGFRALSLLRRLGLSGPVAVRHLAARLIAISASPPTPPAREAVNTVVRHLLEGFDDPDPMDLEALSVLKTAAWLPVSFQQAADLTNWRKPGEVQRPFGSETFFSQLPFTDMAALRGSRNAQSFLTFLGLPSEAPTKAVVDHLLHCSAHGLAPSENIYVTLQQRLDRDRAEIGRLIGKRCIYLPRAEGFQTADAVFWNQPPLRTYWRKTTSYHAQRESLFRFLGIEDDPGPKHYAALVAAIVEENPGGLAGLPHQQMAYAQCLERIAHAAADPSEDADAVLELLDGVPFLLTQALTFAHSDEVVWCDLPRLAEPFGEDLSDVLVMPPFDRTAAGALFHRLDVPALSTAVRLMIAGLDNERADPEAAEAIRRRAPLLLWLAPSADAAVALSRVLRTLTVSRVGALTQRAEFLNGENPIMSPTMAVDAFYDPDDVRLYAKVADDDVEPDWSAVFAHLFASVFQGGETVDLPALVLSAVVVVTAASEHAAERALQQAGFRRPELLDEDVEVEPEDEPDPESPTYDWGMDPTAPVPSDAEAAGRAAAEAAAGPDAAQPASPAAPSPSTAPAPAPSPDPSSDPSSPATATPSGQVRTPPGGDDPVSTDRPTPGAPATPPATVRTQRMLAYVSQRPAKPAAAPGSQAPYDNPIDEAAMQAALAFERKAGRGPVRQSHTNKGYDIVSTDPATGERRLIEVKGLENAWTARGVKVTRTQFATAQHHGEAFWLYVVEHAQDTHAQLLTPLRNPFDKVEEYWFDHLWREAAEQAVKGPDILIQPGTRLRHKHFGLGTVEKATKRGAILDLVIAFADCKKSLPYSKEMELLS